MAASLICEECGKYICVCCGVCRKNKCTCRPDNPYRCNALCLCRDSGDDPWHGLYLYKEFRWGDTQPHIVVPCFHTAPRMRFRFVREISPIERMILIRILDATPREETGGQEWTIPKT